MDEAYRQRLNAWSDERRSELASQAALWFSADGVTAPPTTPMGMYAPLQRSMAAFSDLPLAEEFLPTELAGTRKLSSLSGAPRVTSIIQSLMTAVDYFGDVLSMWDSDGGRSMAQIATGVVDPRGTSTCTGISPPWCRPFASARTKESGGPSSAKRQP